MAVEIVRYADEHFAPLVAGLREIDRRELYMLSRLQPADAFALTVGLAVAAWTAIDDGRVVCVFGINRRSMLSSVGVPWLVGTDEVALHGREFARKSRGYFSLFERAFPQMENFVLEENAVTVRWLKWLGFDMDEPERGGFARAPFIRFSKGMR